MNPGISIRFGTQETHKSPPHLGGNGEHFTYFPNIPNNQGTCFAVAAIIHNHNSAGVRRCRLPALVQFALRAAGGSQADYVNWARAVPGVTRAWAAPEQGVGAMTVRFLMDDLWQSSRNVRRIPTSVGTSRYGCTRGRGREWQRRLSNPSTEIFLNLQTETHLQLGYKNNHCSGRPLLRCEQRCGPFPSAGWRNWRRRCNPQFVASGTAIAPICS